MLATLFGRSRTTARVTFDTTVPYVVQLLPRLPGEPGDQLRGNLVFSIRELDVELVSRSDWVTLKKSSFLRLAAQQGVMHEDRFYPASRIDFIEFGEASTLKVTTTRGGEAT